LLFLILFIQISIAAGTPLPCVEQKIYGTDSHRIVLSENCTFYSDGDDETIEVVNKKDAPFEPIVAHSIINGNEVVVYDYNYEYSSYDQERYTDNFGVISFSIPSKYLHAGENSVTIFDSIYEDRSASELENYTYYSKDILIYPFEYYPSLDVRSITTKINNDMYGVTYTITNRGENSIIPDIGIMIYGRKILEANDKQIYIHSEEGCGKALFCDDALVEIVPRYSDANYSVGIEELDLDDLELVGIEDAVELYSKDKGNHVPINLYYFRDLELGKGQQMSFSFNVSFNSSQKIKELVKDGKEFRDATLIEPLYRYVGARNAVNPYTVSVVNATEYGMDYSKPKDWFEYLMNKTDELIGKNRNPRMGLVFVPIGYDPNESEEFRSLAKDAANRFLSVSPFRECDLPEGQIEVYAIDPSACNISGCRNICGKWDGEKDCQALVEDCSVNVLGQFDFAIGLCKGTSCGGKCGGCAKDIPSKTVVVNTADCGGADAAHIVTHELGHALGIYHVNSTFGVNGCWDHEGGACLGPNADDCKLDDENRSAMIMAYCPSMDVYGPAGYKYLKNRLFPKYVDGCYK
jgi:hypothetical protein